MSVIYFLLKLFLIIGAVFFVYGLLTKKYVSPYTLEIYFGKKGCEVFIRVLKK